MGMIVVLISIMRQERMNAENAKGQPATISIVHCLSSVYTLQVKKNCFLIGFGLSNNIWLYCIYKKSFTYQYTTSIQQNAIRRLTTSRRKFLIFLHNQNISKLLQNSGVYWQKIDSLVLAVQRHLSTKSRRFT